MRDTPSVKSVKNGQIMMQSNNVKCYIKPLNYGVPSFGQTHVKKNKVPTRSFFFNHWIFETSLDDL